MLTCLAVSISYIPTVAILNLFLRFIDYWCAVCSYQDVYDSPYG